MGWAYIGKKSNAYKVMVKKLKKRELLRSWHRWEHNIKGGPKEIGYRDGGCGLDLSGAG
jgi:hypothetical protein